MNDVLSEVLDEIEDFLDNHSDAEGNGPADFRPNTAMRLLVRLREAREAYKTPPDSGGDDIRALLCPVITCLELLTEFTDPDAAIRTTRGRCPEHGSFFWNGKEWTK